MESLNVTQTLERVADALINYIKSKRRQFGNCYFTPLISFILYEIGQLMGYNRTRIKVKAFKPLKTLSATYYTNFFSVILLVTIQTLVIQIKNKPLLMTDYNHRIGSAVHARWSRTCMLPAEHSV